jgi:hypothetical protein
MDRLNLLIQEIESIISKSLSKTDLNHARSTKKWLLILKPDADVAMQIAALAHDIERGIYNEGGAGELSKDYNKYKEEHAKRSAKIICDLLRKHKFDQQVIEKVNNIVLSHEVGGEEDIEIVKDADSISFFEENLEHYFERYGRKRTKFKVSFMFERVSVKAKEIIKKFKFKDEELDLIFREIVD